jgi:DNA (cytosine-5)-methyltransferase 1
MIDNKIVKGGFFDGIGGFDVAADWMDWHTAFHCELDDFCAQILKYHWPHAKNYRDITTADLAFWRGKIDVLTGGFPCQPFSHAGNRKGTNDNRYLWPQMCQGIDTIRPTFVVGENVTGIVTMEDTSGVSKDVFFRVDSRNIARLEEIDSYEAIYTRQSEMLLHNIVQDLEKIGYAVQTFVVPASATQAPHRRDRTWIVAYSNSSGLQKKGTQQQTARIKQYGKLYGYATNPNGDVTGHTGLGQTGSEAGTYQEEKDQWEWLWSVVGGTGTQTDVANAQHHGQPTTQNRGSYGKIGQGGKEGKEVAQQPTGIYEPGELGSVSGNVAHTKSRGNGGLRDTQKETGPQESDKPFGSEHRVSDKKGNATNSTGLRRGQNYGWGKPRQFNQEGTGEYWQHFPTQSLICSGNDGFQPPLDGITFSKWRNQSIKAYGNAVVPQVVLEFYKAIEIELLKIQAQNQVQKSR